MKPAFTDRPEAWTRASRISQSPADYASALHRFHEERTHPAEWIVLAIFLGSVIAFAWGF